MPRVSEGKIYYSGRGITRVDRVYNSGDHGDPESRWYAQGEVLDFDYGVINFFIDRSIGNIGKEVSGKDLAKLRREAIKRGFSLEALRLLGAKRFPAYITRFKKGNAYYLKNQKQNVIVFVIENNYPFLKCLEVRLRPFRMLDSEHRVTELDPNVIPKSFLRLNFERIREEVEKEIFGE